MLQCLKSALSVKGRYNRQIAADIGRSEQTVSAWLNGRKPVPPRARVALATAIGADVDWQAYDAEYCAAQADRRANPPSPTLPPVPAKPAPRPAPRMPAEAQTRPVETPRRLTATPPAEKQTRAPAAPSSASKANGGIFGFLKFDDSDDGMKFA